MRYVDKDGPDGCWLWTGGRAGSTSVYGIFTSGTRASDPKTYAHRYSYEMFVGLIPNDLVIDHLCRNKLCVNPDHLEAVTQQENLARRPWAIVHRPQPNIRLKVCRSGRHDLTDPANVRWDEDGRRRGCLPCRQELEARRSLRRAG
jgi:hypothetical protein